MSIIRTHHNKENPYVIINKESVWDSNLSLEAVGLWTRLMSRPDNWKVYTSELCISCNCGKERIQRILRELIEGGFAFRYRPHKENGQFENWETVVFETKKSKEEIQKMFPGKEEPKLAEYKKKIKQNAEAEGHEKEIQKMFPETENPALVNQGQEKPATNNIDSTNQISKDIFKDKKEKAPSAPPLLEKGKYVKISLEDLTKLFHQFGQERTEKSIQEMNDYLEATGKKPYKDYAAALRNWMRREFKNGSSRILSSEESNKRENILIAKQAQSQLRSFGMPRYKEFYISEKELIRLDTGKRVSLYLPPKSFEQSMMQIFELVKNED